MKKPGFVFLASILCASVLGVGALSGCSGFGGNSGDVVQTADKNITSIQVVEGSVPEYIIAGKFDDAGIQLRVNYSDGTAETVPVRTSFIPQKYHDYLNKAGFVSVEILYRGQTTRLELRFVDEFNTVRFFAYLDENVYRLISMTDIYAGQSAEAPILPQTEIYANNGVHYTFKEWDKTFDHILADTDVYALYDEINYYTVTFYNGNGHPIQSTYVDEGSGATAPSESDRAIEGFDFIGWDRGYSDVHSNLNIYGIYVAAEEVNRPDGTFDHRWSIIGSRIGWDLNNGLALHYDLDNDRHSLRFTAYAGDRIRLIADNKSQIKIDRGLVLATNDESLLQLDNEDAVFLLSGTYEITVEDRVNPFAEDNGACDIKVELIEEVKGLREDNPLSPEDATVIASALGANGRSEFEYYVEGYVTLITSAYDSGYKYATFYIGSTAEKTKAESFFLYRIGVDTEELGAKILKGAKVLVKCTLYNYNGNTPENSGGKLLSAEGGQASVRPTGKGWEQANPFTVAEALARCASLEANVNDEFDCFVTGVITKIDVKTETYAYFYIGDTADATNVLEVSYLPLSEGQNDLLHKGATVLVNVYLKKYKSTSDPSKPEILETAGISGEKLILAEGGVYVPKTGKGWEESNPFSVTEALAEAVNPEQDAYVKGVISKVGTYSTQYKNVDVTLADIDDPTKTILIYRVVYEDQAAFEAALKDKLGSIAIAKGKIGSYKDVNQITNPILTVTDQKPEVTPATEPAIITKTVEEILALGDKDIKNQLYQFTGILEGKKDDDKYGNGYVTDPASGKSVKLYGNTTTATAITFDGSTGEPVYSYKNAKDANTTLKDIHNGDVVTVKGLWSGSHGNFSAVTTSHETTDAKYKATVDLGIEHGSVGLSKTSEIAYGEEVTVTATPDEGYVLEKLVVVNAQGTETDITADKKFNATCVNVVKATFALDDNASAG